MDLNLSLPIAWAHLSQRQLRFIYRMFADNLLSLTEVKVIFMLRAVGARLVASNPDGSSVIRLGSQLILFSPDELAGMVSSLDWMGEIPSVPVRLLKVCGRRAVSPTLNELSFESFIAADNWFQGYLATQKPSCLLELAKFLYPRRSPIGRLRPFRPSPAELTSVFFWFAAFKAWASRRWPHFLVPVNRQNAPAKLPPKLPSPDVLRQAVDAQIRALTKGDISKESLILHMPCHRALTELDAIARESEELKAYKESKSNPK